MTTTLNIARRLTDEGSMRAIIRDVTRYRRDLTAIVTRAAIEAVDRTRDLRESVRAELHEAQ